MNLDTIFIVVGAYGLIITTALSVSGNKTLSQLAQTLCPRWLDWIIGIGGFIVLCCIPISKPIAVFWAGFWGHIWIANKERYED